jgi:hypothetical protein
MSVVIPSLRAAIAVPPWVKNELWRRARAVPSLDLRFADNKSLVDAVTGASLITFNRASSGTYTDSAGVIQTASNNVPRFDHNPTTGESLGLLAGGAEASELGRCRRIGVFQVAGSALLLKRLSPLEQVMESPTLTLNTVEHPVAQVFVFFTKQQDK